jgi:hypothetical protein
VITGPWNAQKDGTVTTVAGTHQGTRVVATCERLEDAKAIATVPELVESLKAVLAEGHEAKALCPDCECAVAVSDGLSSSTLDRIEALIERAEGLRG